MFFVSVNLSPSSLLAGIDHVVNRVILSVILDNDCKTLVIENRLAESGNEAEDAHSELNMKGKVSYIPCNMHVFVITKSSQLISTSPLIVSSPGQDGDGERNT